MELNLYVTSVKDLLWILMCSQASGCANSKNGAAIVSASALIIWYSLPVVTKMGMPRSRCAQYAIR
jgi:hypothetical protein